MFGPIQGKDSQPQQMFAKNCRKHPYLEANSYCFFMKIYTNVTLIIQDLETNSRLAERNRTFAKHSYILHIFYVFFC